ncbi:MAG TPA: alkaline phosphatase family protein [Nitrospirota bacterium]|nr:alkaline phosphatase family protein [Nitrospirota bacterium]
MLSLFKKKNPSPKVVVLGLDGVPYSLLMEYMRRGIMPQLSGLCTTNGSLLPMRSTLPEISSVAWSSFITGKNPGQHGIFGFMEIDRQSYNYTFPNFQSLRERPVWEREGIKAVALNIPQTYPAAPMNGVMVSGFVAIDLRKATYPERVYNYLKDMGYRLDVNARLAQENPEAFFNDLFETFDKRKEAIEYLYENEEWQLFIGTVTETDRLHHYFFDSSREGKYYPVFERFYSELDRFIGAMARRAINEGAVFMTCSDHGFTTIDSEVYLNRWLMEKGYLSLNGTDGLKGILQESRAFCLDPSRIYIHSEGRYGRGSVKRGDYEKVRDGLKEGLDGLAFDGRKVIKEVYLKEEIFKGDFTENGPDIYLLPNYGFDLKGAVNRDKMFGTSHFKGMHTYDDAHLFSTVPLNIDGIKIEDIAAIIGSSLRPG